MMPPILLADSVIEAIAAIARPHDERAALGVAVGGAGHVARARRARRGAADQRHHVADRGGDGVQLARLRFGALRQVAGDPIDRADLRADALRGLPDIVERRLEPRQRAVEIGLQPAVGAAHFADDARGEIALGDASELRAKQVAHARLVGEHPLLLGLPVFGAAAVGGAQALDLSHGAFGAKLRMRRCGERGLGIEEGAADHLAQEDQARRLDDHDDRVQHHPAEVAAAGIDRHRQQEVERQVVDGDEARGGDHRDGVAVEADQRQHGEIIHVHVDLPGVAVQRRDHQRDLRHQGHRDGGARRGGVRPPCAHGARQPPRARAPRRRATARGRARGRR